ncbi:hypothetical protein OCU04_007270 [Sclerotinia nivalis]|uniref:Uncharacterized protein n=1 Tax=Sclerotinia nivalis TaxID=352851 RepID=A0A9X0DIN4_9HELO|nr:hypothetical protein OCU04_007270 [Sclerotinia nivalis]
MDNTRLTINDPPDLRDEYGLSMASLGITWSMYGWSNLSLCMEFDGQICIQGTRIGNTSGRLLLSATSFLKTPMSWRITGSEDSLQLESVDIPLHYTFCDLDMPDFVRIHSKVILCLQPQTALLEENLWSLPYRQFLVSTVRVHGRSSSSSYYSLNIRSILTFQP